MSESVPKVSGTTSGYKQDVGGKIPVNYPVKGIVKNTIDANRSGRIQVYIADFGGKEDDSKSWTSVQYLSPFFGMTQGDNAPDSTGQGSFKTNHHSYGFWATPPDVGSEVICIFLNGKSDFGYYIGGIPKTGSHHMVPGIGANIRAKPSASEAGSYKGALRLPVVEWNEVGNEKLSEFIDVYRPVHSALAGQLHQQGLLRDPIRGAITSSSMRESPSRVFGISTPGRPIYKGGLGGGENDTAIAQKLDGEDDKKLKVTGRRGGHSFVMDDGDIQGQNQLIRLRTSAGHQITMSDDGQTLFVVHANGQSYVELGKEGTVDIYSMNSFNVRTQGDINLHADNNININATKKLNIYAEELNIETDKKTNIKVGDDFTQHTVGNHTVKVEKGMSHASNDAASFVSTSATYINGSVVNLNTGSSSLEPKKVKSYNLITHVDTLFDALKGWLPTPEKLKSIVTRAPAHSPWVSSNMGVDVEVKASAADSLPSPASSAVQNTNNTVPESPQNPTTPAVVATVPPAQPIGNIDPSTTQAIVSQQAVSAAKGPTAAAVAAGSGVVDINGTKQAVIGKLAQTPAQLEQAGIIKPGSSDLVNSLVKQGKSVEEALPPSLFTGVSGINSVSDYVNNLPAQVDTQSTLMQQSYDKLKATGVINGNESAASISGLVSSGALNGVGPTAQFVNGLATNSKSNIGATISEGNYAATLSDSKSSGSSLSLASVAGIAMSAASKGFNAIKSALGSNTTAQSPNVSINNLKDTASGAPNLSAIAGAAGIPKISGTSSMTNAPNVPGLQSLSSGAPDLSALVGKPDISSLPAVLPTTMAATTSEPAKPSGTTLSSVVPEGLGLEAFPDGLASLGSFVNKANSGSSKLNVNAIPTGGEGTTVLPTFAVDTVDRTSVNASAQNLLGPGIPLPITSGGALNIKPLDPAKTKQYDSLKQELDDLDKNKKWELQTAKNKADKTYGVDSSEYKTALQNYKDCLIRIEEIRREMYNLTKG